FFGGQGDFDSSNYILKMICSGVNLCGSSTIRDSLDILEFCTLYIGNDTGWLHIASALGLRCLALFMDSPVMAYGKYSKNISIIVPEGETEETTTHDTLGKDKISFEKVLENSLRLIN
ncbi:MAG: glycosyltransferase family 9 protein, partial [Pelagibacteraceae bacterium]